MASEIESVLGQPVLSLFVLVRQEIERRTLDSIGLLASSTTIGLRLFHHALSDVCEVRCLNIPGQQETERIIRHVIAGKPNIERLNRQLTMFDVPVILGCTELSVLAKNINQPDIIDPLNLAVERIFHD